MLGFGGPLQGVECQGIFHPLSVVLSKLSFFTEVKIAGLSVLLSEC
jgi:hypothetical protein